MSLKDFYNSKVWRNQARYIWLKQHCICAKCNKPVYVDGISDYISKDKRLKGIVHHIIPLSNKNYNDYNISLNENNLIGLCIECHNKEHFSKGVVRDGLMFDELGNLKER